MKRNVMMEIPKITTISLLLIWITGVTYSQGFYKDLFIDGGNKLTSIGHLPAADLLDLTVEYYVSSRYKSALPSTYMDSIIQKTLLCGYTEDLNGLLLYTVWYPRFRFLYVTGGEAANQGESL